MDAASRTRCGSQTGLQRRVDGRKVLRTNRFLLRSGAACLPLESSFKNRASACAASVGGVTTDLRVPERASLSRSNAETESEARLWKVCAEAAYPRPRRYDLRLSGSLNSISSSSREDSGAIAKFFPVTETRRSKFLCMSSDDQPRLGST